MRQYTLTVSLCSALCFLACVESELESQSTLETVPAVRTTMTSGSMHSLRGWFEGTVLHGVHLTPVPGVSVHLTGTQYRAESNELGIYQLPRIQGFNRVEVRQQDFQTADTRVGTNTLLWPRSISEQEANTVFRRRRSSGQDSDDLHDPDLTETARDLIAHQRDHGEWFERDVPYTRHLKQGIVPPPTIRIYRRGPENNSCQGQVDIIPLEDYVKGVVPHEWIPSWSDESLRAGSIAARSYAWGWIAAGGKYDCADLDDTTRSQVYREDRTARATAATDSTRGVGVIRDGQIVRAEYSAENGDPTEFGVSEPLCTGRDVFGHGRGMCQWGTQRWSTQRGQTAEWMVEHYYPGATTSGGGVPSEPQSQVNLRQRLTRIHEVTCPDPDNMYACADFVNQGWSIGIFDLFVGHQMQLTIEVSNVGDGAANGVMLDLDLVGPYLSVARVETGGRYQQMGAGRHQIEFDTIGAEETSAVVLTLQAQDASVDAGGPASVRTWVSTIDNTYDKPDWALTPRVNEGQTFNEGELRLLTEIDVFNPRHWRWASGAEEMLEGWSAFRGVQSMNGSNSGLVLEVIGGSGVIDSPYLPPAQEPIGEIRLITQPAVPCRIWWRTQEQAFDGSRSIVLDGPVTRIADGLIPENIEQLRLDVSGSTQIVELQVGPAGVLPTVRDAATVGNRDALPPIETRDAAVDNRRFDSRMNSGLDQGPQVGNPPGREPRALSVRSVGGCITTKEGRSPFWFLAVLLLFGLRKKSR